MTDDTVSAARGLTQAEATIRLQTVGFNELTSAKPRSAFAIAWGVLAIAPGAMKQAAKATKASLLASIWNFPCISPSRQLSAARMVRP